jgi:hypothetical protein
LIGAALGSGQELMIHKGAPRATPRAVVLYWNLLGVASVLVAGWGLMQEGRGGGFLLFACIGPAVQAGVSVLHLIVLVLKGSPRADYIHAGKIFLGTLIGTLIGAGILYFACIDSTRLR